MQFHYGYRIPGAKPDYAIQLRSKSISTKFPTEMNLTQLNHFLRSISFDVGVCALYAADG